MKPLVLIAESDSSLADLYRRFLLNEGYEVALAGDGQECWAVLCSARPDMLVLEWELPPGGGALVLARLREDWSGAWLPVILAATEDPAQEPLRAATNGAAAFFQKPFACSALAEALRAARSYLQEAFSVGGRVRIRRGCLAGLSGHIVHKPLVGSWLLQVCSPDQGCYVRIGPDALEPADEPSEPSSVVDDQARSSLHIDARLARQRQLRSSDASRPGAARRTADKRGENQ